MNKDDIIQILLAKIEEFEKYIQLLKNENIALQKRLDKLEHPKNSDNSSIAPSQDPNRPKRTSSLREKSGRKSGGQKRRKGKTLEMSAHPDEVVKESPYYCERCGQNLETVPVTGIDKRQVVDIIPLKVKVTEYQSLQKQCSCGCITRGSFPDQVRAKVSYGPVTEGLIGYMHTHQYLPHRRLTEMLQDVFGLPISEGTVDNVLTRLSDKAAPVYEHIRRQVEQSNVVGADETSVNINGKKGWIWVWQNAKYTYVNHHASRGKEAVKANFPDGFKNATLIHDCWKPHLNTPAKNHQLCIPHLLREIKFLKQKYDDPWVEAFGKLLNDALERKETILEETQDGDESKSLVKLVDRLDRLLADINTFNPQRKDLVAFYNRLVKYKDHLFVFLIDPEVPGDNNGSERDMRKIVVKNKISGLFRSTKGAERYMMLRSIVDTVKKNGQNIYHALQTLAENPTLVGE